MSGAPAAAGAGAGGGRLRVALLGGAGQLGRDLAHALARHELLAPPRAEADVTDASALARVLAPFRPDWVVTTAAFHDVDRCEEEPERALRENALGAALVAREAARLGARTLYVSTDYVFAGTKGSPYRESDLPGPVNAYGASKLAGEALARACDPRALVVRTSCLYGPHPCRGKGGRNFVDLMLRLGRERGRVRVVDDEVLAPTYTPHLAAAMAAALERGVSGLLHLAGAGHCSFLELARAALAEAGIEAAVERALPGEFPKKAARPAFSALESERLAAEGLEPLPHWREGLRAHLAARATAAA